VCTVERQLASEWRPIELGLLGMRDEHTKAIALCLSELELSDEERQLFDDPLSSERLGRGIEARLTRGEQMKAAVTAAVQEEQERKRKAEAAKAAEAAEATKAAKATKATKATKVKRRPRRRRRQRQQRSLLQRRTR